MQNHKGPPRTGAILRDKSKAGGIVCWFQALLQSCSEPNRHKGQQNRTERSKVNPHIQTPRNFPLFQWGKGGLLNTRCWESRCLQAKDETEPRPYTTHKNNSKWIHDSNVRPKTYFKENREKTFLMWVLAVISLEYDATSSKIKINKRDCVKLKSFCTAQGTINKMKGQPKEWETVFASPYLVRG